MNEEGNDDIPFHPPDFSKLEGPEAQQKAVSWYLMASNEWTIKEQTRARKELREMNRKLDRVLTIGKVMLWIIGPIYSAALALIVWKIK